MSTTLWSWVVKEIKPILLCQCSSEFCGLLNFSIIISCTDKEAGKNLQFVTPRVTYPLLPTDPELNLQFPAE